METRGWKLCICFGLLSVALAKDASQSVPGARQDELIFSEFTLVHDLKSQLFSSCFDELNTVEAALQAIEVDEGKEYIRYLIDSDAEVTWEDVEGEDDIIACAFKAYEAGSLMFKHSNGVCSLATEGVYNPKDISCDGEEVFIISPLDFCFTSLGVAESGHQYFSWQCELNCDSAGILTDQSGDEVDPDSLPSEIVECCSTETTPCLHSMKEFDSACEAVRYCHFLGMMLPSVVPGDVKDRYDQFYKAEVSTQVRTLVNVRYESDGYYHFPGKIPVNSNEWEGGVAPTTEGLVALGDDATLIPLDDSAPVFAVCQAQDELPMCPESE